jgi:GT2 family glycosyltransferase
MCYRSTMTSQAPAREAKGIDGDSLDLFGHGRSVSVVIVNWNGGEDLALCVENLRSGVGGRVDEIVVVDNDSSDDSLARLGAPEGVTVIQAGRNLGFAAGANLGAGRCRSERVLFLNPDARIMPGAIDAAANFLAAHPRVGIVGALLVDGRGAWQPSAGRFGVLGHLLLDTALGRRPPSAARFVDWVHGAFMLMPRALFERLGGFDEGFFMYGEDMDLCERVRAAGFRTAIVPEVRVVHYGNRSGGLRFGEERDAEVVKGEMRFYAHRGRLLLFRVVAIAKFGLKAMLYLLLGKRAAARRTWRVVKACISAALEDDGVSPDA